MPDGRDTGVGCGFGDELLWRYMKDRWETMVTQRPDGGPRFQLTRDDLPVLGKAFGLEHRVEDGRIVWTCRICGDLGSSLTCDAEKHRAYWDEREAADREREGVR